MPRALRGHIKGILYTSKQLSDEVSTKFYQNLDVEIHLNGWNPNHWIRWSIQYLNICRYLRTPDKAIRRGYDRFPFYRIRSLRVQIPACDHSDPGQLILLWRHTNRLVELLGRASGVANLKIRLVNGRHNGWDENRKWLRSVDFHGHKCVNVTPFLKTERSLYDHEVVLLPFSRMTNVKKFNIQIGFHYELRDGRKQKLAKMVASCVSRKVMGLELPHISEQFDPWVIRRFSGNINQFIKDVDTSFQYALRADLPGEMAPRLYALEWELALKGLKRLERLRRRERWLRKFGAGNAESSDSGY